MSSHHEWAEEVIAMHDAEKPFPPENGQPLKFKVGDPVIYTNDYGIKFAQTVTGLYQPEKTTTQYALGKRYMLDWACNWMPVFEDSLTLDEERQGLKDRQDRIEAESRNKELSRIYGPARNQP